MIGRSLFQIDEHMSRISAEVEWFASLDPLELQTNLDVEEMLARNFAEWGSGPNLCCCVESMARHLTGSPLIFADPLVRFRNGCDTGAAPMRD